MGAGKSTIASELVESYGYRHHSWAAPLRDLFAMAFDPDALDPQRYPKVKARQYEVRLRDGQLIQRSGRELLQRIGTDAMRDNVDADFWIKTGLRRLDEGGPWVNDDTRFLNEAQVLRERGFLIIRLVRPGLGDTGAHPSETEQEQIIPDLVVYNDQRVAVTVGDLLDRVAA
jgi:hypothetical protein